MECRTTLFRPSPALSLPSQLHRQLREGAPALGPLPSSSTPLLVQSAQLDWLIAHCRVTRCRSAPLQVAPAPSRSFNPNPSRPTRPPHGGSRASAPRGCRIAAAWRPLLQSRSSKLACDWSGSRESSCTLAWRRFSTAGGFAESEFGTPSLGEQSRHSYTPKS